MCRWMRLVLAEQLGLGLGDLWAHCKERTVTAEQECHSGELSLQEMRRLSNSYMLGERQECNCEGMGREKVKASELG